MSKRESRYRYWWYQMVVDMIKNYNRDTTEDGELTKMFRQCIDVAFDELKEKENGEDIKKAIYMIYIDRTHTIEGVAIKLFVGRRTVSRWVSGFIYRVAELTGLK